MKTRTSRLFIFFVTLFLMTSAHAQLPPSVDGKPLPSLADMVDRITPAVVNISTKTIINRARNPLMQDPLFRQFFKIPQQPQSQQSLGSGVVIDADEGYVITNNHVVDHADEITVTLRDGRALPAKLVGTDPDADVALLQVDADNLTAIKIADSDKLRVGDFVVAIGNPFGLGQTVTSGIVSALGRSGLGIEGYEDFIQTDASINPGNSGGALVNLNGELVGMNTAIIAPGGGNVGIGFAIPVNMISQIKSQLVQYGEVRRGMLGVVTQGLTNELAQAFDLDRSSGALVSRVLEDSPADRAGLRSGDIITAVNGREVENPMSLRNAVGMLRIGDSLKIDIIRDGHRKTLKASIEEAKQQQIEGEKVSEKLAGAIISQQEDSQNNNKLSVVIASVQQGSPAWYARLRKGDVILSVNRKPVNDLDDLRDAAHRSRQLLLNIQRGQSALFILLK